MPCRIKPRSRSTLRCRRIAPALLSGFAGDESVHPAGRHWSRRRVFSGRDLPLFLPWLLLSSLGRVDEGGAGARAVRSASGDPSRGMQARIPGQEASSARQDRAPERWPELRAGRIAVTVLPGTAPPIRATAEEPAERP